VEVDPLAPGKAFRADAIIAHPYLFGQTIVAERLGVPLHCMSYNPQSRTQAFPNLISSNMKLHRPYRYAPTNAASYDVIDNVLWNGMRDVLDEFRYFLGLTGKSIANNLLAEWRIPHTYLWNPSLLPKPHDWGNEITIAGYVELEEDHPENTDLAAIEQELCSFARNSAGTPLIYFGFQCGDWDPRRVQDLVGTLEKAARKANVRVVFQGYENSTDDAAFFVGGTDVVFEIDQHFPVKRILPHVHAAIHWGDLSITSTCLGAEKPACVVPRNITQRMWGQALVLSGAGVEPLEMDALTPSNLVHVFRVLLEPKLTHCAKRLAPKFSSPTAIETAVSAFYSNLPLEGMTCDLDPVRIARVYDSVHEMKLSYEARLVVHQLTGDAGSAGDLKYKPLKYSQHHPPRFSLRELELLHSFSSGNLKKIPRTKVLYTYDPASEELAARVDHERASLASSSSSTESVRSKKFGGAPLKKRMQFSRAQSMALNVVEMPKFWNSPEEQAKCTLEINATYEKLLMGRNFANGSSSSSASSVAL
jgi:sterol 3beta-glucosyltransferase